MEKIVLSTSETLTPIAPYSQAIEVGSLVFVAGQVGIEPKTGKLVHGGIRAQTKHAIENLGAILGHRRHRIGSRMDIQQTSPEGSTSRSTKKL
jgi:enamine deaminase RidA (YjgF/YER057c/UK114 family)